MLAALHVLAQAGGVGEGESPEEQLSDAIGKGLTLNDWLIAGGVVLGSIVLAQVLRAVVMRILQRTDADEAVPEFVGRMLRNLIVIIGLVIALGLLEVRISPLLGALGIGGLAVAFAAKSILENTFASVLLRTRRPFRRGDQISVGDFDGVVEDVNLRTVVLRAFDGERVLVPCGMVLNNPIVNHTVRGIRRTTLEIGMTYENSLPLAAEVLKAAAAGVDDVRERPGPEAYVYEFAQSSINIALRFWHAPDIATMWRVRSEVAMAAKAACDAAGIDIAFPHREISFTNPLRTSPSPEEEPSEGVGESETPSGSTGSR